MSQTFKAIPWTKHDSATTMFHGEDGVFFSFSKWNIINFIQHILKYLIKKGW